uniref:Ig-like domain-containing protein n=1 Tax=Cyprinus carpio TaxID=7962 RepID=A0A8C2PNE5_CYPCA
MMLKKERLKGRQKEKMVDECHLCLLGLIALSSLLTGSSGVNHTHVFISSGEHVRLPCNNALHDCTSTTWNYNGFRHSAAIELIAGGKKKKNAERHERLSLGSDCSLNINNISTEDYGSYICQLWTGETGPKQRPDARVYLHVLQVSSSQTEISAGLSVTLFCQLYSHPRGSCDDLIRSEGIQLFWVNQAGVKLTRSDSRYQISSSSDHCIITLTTTLLNEDHNREWRCEVTQRDQVQTSVTYTVKSSAQADSATALTSTEEIVTVIVVCASFVLLLLALILWMMIRKKRSGVRRATDDSVEQTDDVTYTEVTAFSKNRAKKNKVHCDDKVTYASIGGAKAGAQEDCSQLYASVTKNRHKSGK